MVNRKTVMKWLDLCSHPEICCDKDGGCPYWIDVDESAAYEPQLEHCIDGLLRDALALLSEQEPRVITREELEQFEGSPCWFESSGTYLGEGCFWIIPAMFRPFFAGTIMSYISVIDGVADYGELGLYEYNKAWRCWTAKPTDEQREALKWDD